MAKTFDEFIVLQTAPPLPKRRPCAINSQLRPMRINDLDNIINIENRVYEFPWTIDMFENCLTAGYCCWVCGDCNLLHGYSIMLVGAGECHILNLCIAPEFQRRGLGQYLMTHLLHLGKRYNADSAFLEVRASNHAALALYLNLGFNEIGKRRNYYPSKSGREDALMLARNL